MPPPRGLLRQKNRFCSFSPCLLCEHEIFVCVYEATKLGDESGEGALNHFFRSVPLNVQQDREQTLRNVIIAR